MPINSFIGNLTHISIQAKTLRVHLAPGTNTSPAPPSSDLPDTEPGNPRGFTMIDTPCTHRHNRDDTWDSLCPQCHLIIARSDREYELAMHERMHTCDPAIFRRPAPIDYRVFIGSLHN
jgi:hypothetical protein